MKKGNNHDQDLIKKYFVDNILYDSRVNVDIEMIKVLSEDYSIKVDDLNMFDLSPNSVNNRNS